MTIFDLTYIAAFVILANFFGGYIILQIYTFIRKSVW